MKLKDLLLLLIAVIIFSCKKEKLIGDDEYVTLSYHQTYCADLWETGNTDSVTLRNLANYLIDANLYVSSLYINEETPGEMCNACTCKTGKVIYVSTLNSDSLKVKYARIGFKK
jgi:hypothetical protein